MSDIIEKGSGNVFADLGFPDPEAHQVKATLVHTIGRVIDDQGLTQAMAAERMGMSQPDVSKMLKGQFRPISLERLLDCLRALGHDVEIAVKKPKAPRVKVGRAQRGAMRISVERKVA